MDAAGISNYRVSLQQDVARGKVGFFEALQHRCHCRCANIGAVLMLCCERHRKEVRVLNVIDADDTHLFRNADPHFRQPTHNSSGSEVVGTDDGVRSVISEHLSEEVRIVGIAAANQILRQRTTVRDQSFSVASDSRHDS